MFFCDLSRMQNTPLFFADVYALFADVLGSFVKVSKRTFFGELSEGGYDWQDSKKNWFFENRALFR